MTPRKHRHAEMMRQWLDDDSLEIEWKNSDGNWVFLYECAIALDEDYEYRFKPKMIKCGDMEFPEPMRVTPAIGAKYWCPKLTRFDSAIVNTWEAEDVEKEWLSRGLCHATQAAAEQHARALIALTEVELRG